MGIIEVYGAILIYEKLEYPTIPSFIYNQSPLKSCCISRVLAFGVLVTTPFLLHFGVEYH